MKKTIQDRNSKSDMLPHYDFDYAKAKPNRFAGKLRVRGGETRQPNQRIGSVSNSQVGADFELVALKHFAKHGVKLTRNFPVDVGISHKKRHCFDLGSADPRIIVECKSHKWTAGSNVPSAKMTVWNEAMYYFHLAPKSYRKILFVLHDRRSKEGESLLNYYKRTYSHMIPKGVEFLEWDEATGDIVKI
ncbi:MAG TPA: hypothetical protein VN696_16525 [Pyrinomonadaceae bacterium]|nr:hypothetical protein [Pyrinomonadaceae bacterium]